MKKIVLFLITYIKEIILVVVIACLVFLLIRPSNESAKTSPLNDTIPDTSIQINNLEINLQNNSYKSQYNHILPQIDTLKIDGLKKDQKIDTLKINGLKKDQKIDSLKKVQKIDTLKIDSLKLTNKEKEKIENIERIENIVKNLEVIDKQKITLDSLKIKKKK